MASRDGWSKLSPRERWTVVGVGIALAFLILGLSAASKSDHGGYYMVTVDGPPEQGVQKVLCSPTQHTWPCH